ncbi:YdeI/OmpD-associated family protein [Actinopolymorpha pittospori]
MADPMRFTAAVTEGSRGRAVIALPFDPDQVWGYKQRHHVSGTVDGCKVRAVVEQFGDGPGIALSPSWRRDRPVKVGSEVKVVLSAEGPQRADLDPDVAAALEAEPEAGAFFDSLAQFYRKGYLTWINATKRRPEERARRIAETVRLLKTGQKRRPQGA